jgi:hypothetical protein
MSRTKSFRSYLALVLAVVLPACGDECSSYSDFSCSEIQSAEYNVYFYYPSTNQEEYLGQASGLSSCGDVASSFADQKNMLSANWGYVCCMIAEGSSCYEKHR